MPSSRVSSGLGDGGGGDAEPAGLNVHHFDQGEVVLVVEDGGAGELLEAVGSGDVIDVGVGDDDLLDGEVVLGEQGEDAGDVVAGVDDDGFAGGFVAEDGAVALEGADGEGFVDHGLWPRAEGFPEDSDDLIVFVWGCGGRLLFGKSRKEWVCLNRENAQACGLRIF